MKLKAQSYYDGDRDTRFGDCILLHDGASLIVYDCGHSKHAGAVEDFLWSKPSIKQIHIVVSHNDSDHTDGVCELLNWLKEQNRDYNVTVYSHQYLKHTDAILEKIGDARRRRERLKEALLEEFDNIRDIINCAAEHGFNTEEALKGVSVSNCTIVGPTEDEFITVAAQAVDNRESNNIDGETVMNAASVQLSCKLDNAQTVLLCGDASPQYLNKLESYDVIQLPHHGKLASAKLIFDDLKDPVSKTYLISDNTGTGENSGGSDALVEYMEEEYYNPALNTKDKVINIPPAGTSGTNNSKQQQGVKLGEMDYRL